MNKELETLETIKKAKESFECIKEDLDYFQPKDLICTNRKEQYKQIENAFTRLEKLEKAIEICKNKQVYIDNLLISENYYIYNKYVFNYRKLTKEEFNLLKGVFRNERV